MFLFERKKTNCQIFALRKISWNICKSKKELVLVGWVGGDFSSAKSKVSRGIFSFFSFSSFANSKTYSHNSQHTSNGQGVRNALHLPKAQYAHARVDVFTDHTQNN